MQIVVRLLPAVAHGVRREGKGGVDGIAGLRFESWTRGRENATV